VPSAVRNARNCRVLKTCGENRETQLVVGVRLIRWGTQADWVGSIRRPIGVRHLDDIIRFARYSYTPFALADCRSCELSKTLQYRPWGFRESATRIARSNGFVTRSGDKLLLNGQPFRFSGANVYGGALDDDGRSAASAMGFLMA
jgi:hypothetical protein